MNLICSTSIFVQRHEAEKLSAHLFTSFCISSNFLQAALFFRIFYTNLEWLYF